MAIIHSGNQRWVTQQWHKNDLQNFAHTKNTRVFLVDHSCPYQVVTCGKQDAGIHTFALFQRGYSYTLVLISKYWVGFKVLFSCWGNGYIEFRPGYRWWQGDAFFTDVPLLFLVPVWILRVIGNCRKREEIGKVHFHLFDQGETLQWIKTSPKSCTCCRESRLESVAADTGALHWN